MMLCSFTLLQKRRESEEYIPLENQWMSLYLHAFIVRSLGMFLSVSICKALVNCTHHLGANVLEELLVLFKITQV